MPEPDTHPPGRADRISPRRVTALLAAAVIGGASLTAVTVSASAGTPEDAGDTRSQSDTGDAETPPMGFNNWNATQCGDDFNEEMIKGIADLIVEKGLKDAGYEYINLDDCWAESERDENGKLVADSERFPSGIEALADYVHSKGLKFGVYTSAGDRTCSGDMPGSIGHEYSDAQQFADWGVDYLKYDNCGDHQGQSAQERYTTMGDALEATGRDIYYAICEWGDNEPWTGWATEAGGNQWRTTFDISDNYGSMLSIFKDNVELAEYSGPDKGWNDPDMLQVGNGGMTDTEYRSHFSLWAIMSAPLLIGTDLRDATEETYEILGNEEVIAVDQDSLGQQGTVVSSEGGRWVISKEMSDGSRVVALFNESDTAQHIETTASEVGLRRSAGYSMRDLWEHETYQTAGTISATVPAHGTVMYRVSAKGKWASQPSAVEVGGTDIGYTEAGTTHEVTTTATNLGRAAATDVSVSVDAPEGWQVKAASPTRRATLHTGRSLSTDWTVTIPESTEPGDYELTVTADYRSNRHREQVEFTTTVHVKEPPPEGTSYLSDLDWISATNGGFGGVQKDTNGSGNAISIRGTTYEKGLGVSADSTVLYYAGEHCTEFSAVVGVDDSTNGGGSVSFEVWADDTKVASTGVLTGTDAAETLTADLTGADTFKLVVTDGDTERFNNAADWADAKITCTS